MANWLGIKATMGDFKQEALNECGDSPEAYVTKYPVFRNDLSEFRWSWCKEKTETRVMTHWESDQKKIDDIVFTSSILGPIFLIVVFHKQILRMLESIVVFTGAVAIKSKEASSSYRADLKSRMEERAKGLSNHANQEMPSATPPKDD